MHTPNMGYAQEVNIQEESVRTQHLAERHLPGPGPSGHLKFNFVRSFIECCEASTESRRSNCGNMSTWETRQSDSNRVLDTATRERRLKQALEALEKDNFQDDPFVDGGSDKKVPKFEETGEGNSKRKRVRAADYFKNKYTKSFQMLVEEDLHLNPSGPNYTTAEAPPSVIPKRNFCAVCGFPAPYTCVQCKAKFCQTKCLTTHRDTRCLKWTG
ncbi:unnamed protein product [Allacma fusca]|uniref:HIT-type domain-containing protein n=1 Tax=Allacma fusca TaxID=39272 RepID=A0A8J2JBB8_9HEXA|nr:unnamed protein product [Allacma fusca]